MLQHDAGASVSGGLDDPHRPGFAGGPAWDVLDSLLQQVPADLLAALSDGTRRTILRRLHDAGRPLSPHEIRKEGESTAVLAYHVRRLATFGLVERAGPISEGGRRQSRFRSTVASNEVVRTVLTRLAHEDSGA